MDGIVIYQPQGDRADASLLDQMFALRHKVFKERLGWEVKSVAGREHDEFDALRPTYVLYRNAEGVVEGCGRLLPTTGPYMLKDVFPELLDGQAPPRSPVVWESSRFAVLPASPTGAARAMVSHITSQLLLGYFRFAFAKGIRRIVSLTDVRVERVLNRAGLKTQRMGEPRWIGHSLAVAGWMDVTLDNLRSVLARAAAVEAPLAAVSAAALAERQVDAVLHAEARPH